jgi:hypothetical protein
VEVFVVAVLVVDVFVVDVLVFVVFVFVVDVFVVDVSVDGVVLLAPVDDLVLLVSLMKGSSPALSCPTIASQAAASTAAAARATRKRMLEISLRRGSPPMGSWLIDPPRWAGFGTWSARA